MSGASGCIRGGFILWRERSRESRGPPQAQRDADFSLSLLQGAHLRPYLPHIGLLKAEKELALPRGEFVRELNKGSTLSFLKHLSADTVKVLQQMLHHGCASPSLRLSPAPARAHSPPYSDVKVANRNGGGFGGWEDFAATDFPLPI